MAPPTNPDTVRAFETLVLHLQPWLLKRAVSLCRSKQEAGDLVQDTLERAWRSFPALRPDSNLRAWLLRIMRNLAIDRHRQAARQGHVSIDPDNLTGSGTAHSSAAADIDYSTEQLRRALATLSSSHQLLLELWVIDSLTYQGISASLGIPVRTVGSRLFRAREQLRTLLAETGPPGQGYLKKGVCARPGLRAAEARTAS
jgi:RNA polymerase sigma-70 factor (ECF subfamily)